MITNRAIIFLIIFSLGFILNCEEMPVEERKLDNSSFSPTTVVEYQNSSNRLLNFTLTSLGRVKIIDLEGGNGVITAIPYQTDLNFFKEELDKALKEFKATYKIYDNNNQLLIKRSKGMVFLQDNYKVVITSEDQKTTLTFTINVKSPSSEARIKIVDKSIISNKKGLPSLEMLLLSGVLETTSLEKFRQSLSPVNPRASFEIYEPDGVSLATSLKTGTKVVVTAEDGETKLIYTVILKRSDGSVLPLEIVNQDGIISKVSFFQGEPFLKVFGENPYVGIWESAWGEEDGTPMKEKVVIDDYSLSFYKGFDYNKNGESDIFMGFSFDLSFLEVNWKEVLTEEGLILEFLFPNNGLAIIPPEAEESLLLLYFFLEDKVYEEIEDYLILGKAYEFPLGELGHNPGELFRVTIKEINQDTLSIKTEDKEDPTFVSFTKSLAEPIHLFTYDGNGNSGGKVPAEARNYAEGNYIKILGNTGSLIKTGYVFRGWCDTPEGNGLCYSAGDILPMGLVDLKVYANWRDPNYSESVVTSTFNYNGNLSTGGEVPASQDYPTGERVIVLNNPGNLGKSGYYFGGWCETSDGSGNCYLGGETIVIGDVDFTLYAKWNPFATVTYYGNGNTGGNPPSPTSYPPGASFNTPGNPGLLEKTGYTFVDWCDTADGSKNCFFENDILAVGSYDLGFYARWEELTYTVTYDLNGANGVTPLDNNQYKKGETFEVPSPEDFFCEGGEDFIGWSEDPNEDGYGYGEIYDLYNIYFEVSDYDITLYGVCREEMLF